MQCLPPEQAKRKCPVCILASAFQVARSPARLGLKLWGWAVNDVLCILLWRLSLFTAENGCFLSASKREITKVAYIGIHLFLEVLDQCFELFTAAALVIQGWWPANAVGEISCSCRWRSGSWGCPQFALKGRNLLNSRQRLWHSLNFINEDVYDVATVLQMAGLPEVPLHDTWCKPMWRAHGGCVQ